MGCLYSIQSLSGKVYIGITMGSAAERFHRHCTDSERGEDSLLCRAIRKYGKENCILTTLVHSDDWKVLCQLEKDYIRHFNTKTHAGYNLTDGGDGSVGLKWNEEQRKRQSEILLGRKMPFRKSCTREPGFGGKKHRLESKVRIAVTSATNYAKYWKISYSVYDAQFVVGDFFHLTNEYPTWLTSLQA